jgi:uncharacterized integral membrane protein
MSDNGRKKSSGKSGGSGGSAMSKKLILALVIFAITVIVLIFSGMKPKVDIDLIITSVTIYKSLAFLGFTITGVVIGVLLK